MAFIKCFVLLSLLAVMPAVSNAQPQTRVDAILDRAVASPMQGLARHRRFHVRRENIVTLPSGVSTSHDEIFVDGRNERISSYSKTETKHLVVNADGTFIITKSGIERIDDDTKSLEEFIQLYSILDTSLDPSLNYLTPELRNTLYSFEHLGTTYINQRLADVVRMTARLRNLSPHNSTIYILRDSGIVVRRVIPEGRLVISVLNAEKIRGRVLPTVIEFFTTADFNTRRTYTIRINPKFPRNTFDVEFLAGELQ